MVSSDYKVTVCITSICVSMNKVKLAAGVVGLIVVVAAGVFMCCCNMRNAVVIGNGLIDF